MVFQVIKAVFSGLFILIINSFASKNPTFGGKLAALPLVSMLSVLWLAFDKSDNTEIIKFLIGVLWGIFPTVAMLGAMVICMKNGASLLLSGIIGAIICLAISWLVQRIS